MVTVRPIADTSGDVFKYDPSSNPGWYSSAPPAVGGLGSRPGSVPIPVSTAPQNTAMAIAAGQSVDRQLPGYDASLANIGSNIKSETAGQLPSDVVTQIEQQMAERGVGTGTQGSDTNNASLICALGLTTLDLTGTGQSQFQSILPTLPGYNIAQNPSQYVNPAEIYEANLQNTLDASAPDPNAAASASLGAARAGLGAVPSLTGGELPPTPGGGEPLTNDWGNTPPTFGYGPGGGPDTSGGYPGLGPNQENPNDWLTSMLRDYSQSVTPSVGWQSNNQ